MKLINTTYPANKYEIDDTLVSAWHTIFGHYDETALKAAALKTFTKCKFPPVPADITSELKGLMYQGLPSKGEAWEAARDAVDYCGLCRYEKGEAILKGRAPIILKAVNQLGGLRAIDECDKEEIIRGQFMRIYEELLARTVEEGVTSPAVMEAARLMGQGAQKALMIGGPSDVPEA